MDQFINDLSLFDNVKNLNTLRLLTKDLNIRYLSNGSFSEVLTLKIKPNREIILKLSILDKNEETCDEWTFAQYLNNLIKIKQGPHFLYTYKLLTIRDRSYCLIQDKAEFNLAQICHMKLSKAVQISLFVQLMISMYIIQSRYQIAHRDIKSENIFLKTLREPVKITYETDLRTFTVTLNGYWLYLGDFNVSYSFHPNYSHHGLLGERNAKLIGTTLFPIKTRVNGKSEKIVWSTGQLTNRIYLKSNMILANQINIYNPFNYPPFEFIDDTIDACRTFIGGPRCLLDNWHEGLKYLDNEIHRALSNLIFTDISYREGIFDINKGYLCNAGLLLEQIYDVLKIDESSKSNLDKSLFFDLKGLVEKYSSTSKFRS